MSEEMTLEERVEVLANVAVMLVRKGQEQEQRLEKLEAYVEGRRSHDH